MVLSEVKVRVRSISIIRYSTIGFFMSNVVLLVTALRRCIVACLLVVCLE